MNFSGKVIRGSGRGKGLGFPTANLDIIPQTEEGIYVGWANQKPALIFIGAAETFEEQQKKCEVYFLDNNFDGQEVSVELLKKIRDNKKFDSKLALIEQMKQDEQVAREFFKQYNQNN